MLVAAGVAVPGHQGEGEDVSQREGGAMDGGLSGASSCDTASEAPSQTDSQGPGQTVLMAELSQLLHMSMRSCFADAMPEGGWQGSVLRGPIKSTPHPDTLAAMLYRFDVVGHYIKVGGSTMMHMHDAPYRMYSFAKRTVQLAFVDYRVIILSCHVKQLAHECR